MGFTRAQLLDIIKPHVLRAVVRLRTSAGDEVTDADLAKTGLSQEELQALIQTKRLLPQGDGVYKVNLEG